VQPNGKRLIGPPEAVSLTFDPNTGKVVKMCSEFAMDRFVGNTFGLCGVMAAAAVAGVPPSDWEIYPITTVVSRFFGRPADPAEEVSTSLSPFPETVMIQLVKGILATKLAADDPSLLAKDFSFITPSVGPIGKAVFLESYASQEFGGFEPEFSNFRVDPFDPRRVWVDVKLVGPGLNGPPQAFSFTINDDGFCTRMTAGAVMVPSIGKSEVDMDYTKSRRLPGICLINDCSLPWQVIRVDWLGRQGSNMPLDGATWILQFGHFRLHSAD
jgi:hypothetical protein